MGGRGYKAKGKKVKQISRFGPRAGKPKRTRKGRPDVSAAGTPTRRSPLERVTRR